MTDTADTAWTDVFEDVLTNGREVAPRGRRTLELSSRTVRVDMRWPVITARPGLNRRFMAAEALWMLQGRDDVEMLAEHVPRMRDYSDDGRTLAGAYGPPIAAQLNYVVTALRDDRATRQAVLTTWRPNPMPSRDIPCTVAMAFQIRDNRLDAHVFMRSSDVWLGLPYDIFSFTMIAEWVRIHYNLIHGIAGDRAQPGTLCITAASSHLYEEHWHEATRSSVPAASMPAWASPTHLLAALDELTRSRRGDPARWWES